MIAIIRYKLERFRQISLITIDKKHSFLNVRVQAQSNRTVLSRFFNKLSLLCAVISWKLESADNFSYFSGVVLHYFLDFTSCIINIDIFGLPNDRNRSQHASAQWYCKHISWREGLTFSLVVSGCITLNLAAAL